MIEHRVGIVLGKMVLVASLVGVSGCGYLFGDDGVFRSTAEDYKKSPEVPLIIVPEGKSADFMQEIYAIPEVDENLVLAGEFEVPRPTPLVAGASDEIVCLQKLGDASWALVAVAPGQVWPQIRSYISSTGLSIARVDARSGIIETGWIKLDGQEMESRFRFRIEQGVQRGNSELHVLQMNRAGDVENWPAMSDDLEQETTLLRGVSQFIANSTDASSVSMIADQSLSASGKISLQESADGHTRIKVRLPYGRAWASLARALEKSAFDINDRNRSTGTYYVQFKGPKDDEEDGWFDWMFEDEEHPLAGRDLLVLMTSQDEEVIINIAPKEGDDPLDKREEQALLVLIKGNIN